MEYKQIETEYRGDKPWELVEIPCDRCGGSGIISSYGYVEGGRCFKCNGRGIETKWRRILTDKEKAQRERAKVRRVEKKIEKNELQRQENEIKNEKFLMGTTYIINLKDTYAIKDELRTLGAKFDHLLNWHFDKEVVTDYPLIAISNKLLYDNMNSLRYNVKDIISEIKMGENGNTGDYVGEIGEKIELELTMYSVFPFSSMYGDGTCYLFNDSDGNILCWYTTSKKEVPKNVYINSFFKVKDHRVYNNIKQTVIKNLKF